jgi:hypothetical protein
MKDMIDRPFGLAGILAQEAVDVAERKLTAMCKVTGEDAAFWRVRVTLELATLNQDFTEITQMVRVQEVNNWNWPGEGKDGKA